MFQCVGYYYNRMTKLTEIRLWIDNDKPFVDNGKFNIPDALVFEILIKKIKDEKVSRLIGEYNTRDIRKKVKYYYKNFYETHESWSGGTWKAASTINLDQEIKRLKQRKFKLNNILYQINECLLLRDI